MTNNVPDQNLQSRLGSSRRSPRADTWSLVAVTLMPLLAGSACEAILHLGRAGQSGVDGGGSDGAGGGARDGRGLDAAGGGARDGGGLDAAGAAPRNDGGFDAVGGAATDGPVPPSHPPLTSASKLDLMFVIDDSFSMAPLQAKMRARIPQFMEVLTNVPGGLPDVHIAVVSTSLGAGLYANVPGCSPNTLGNLDGEFQHRAACTQLNPGATFISATRDATGARVENFVGDINTLFSCMADLGDVGCGFEHPFESARLALQRALTANDVNSGFLRDDAYLAVVMLANEDDCSVPANSMLFDPSQQSVSDPLGGLRSYRCNEFGHLCGGQSPPHLPPTSSVPLADCVSNENGFLVPVAGFVDFLFSLKPGHPEKIFLGAIAGPPTPYVIGAASTQLGTGASEIQALVQHSCTSSNGAEFADPAVRIQQATSAFGPNGLLVSICADDFGPIMTTMAQTMVRGQ